MQEDEITEDLYTQLYVNSLTRDKRQDKQRIMRLCWVSHTERERVSEYELNVDKP